MDEGRASTTWTRPPVGVADLDAHLEQEADELRDNILLVVKTYGEKSCGTCERSRIWRPVAKARSGFVSSSSRTDCNGGRLIVSNALWKWKARLLGMADPLCGSGDDQKLRLSVFSVPPKVF